jgi:hypothetical protein
MKKTSVCRVLVELTITSEDAFDKGDFFISTSKNIESGSSEDFKFHSSSIVEDCGIILN